MFSPAPLFWPGQAARLRRGGRTRFAAPWAPAGPGREQWFASSDAKGAALGAHAWAKDGSSVVGEKSLPSPRSNANRRRYRTHRCVDRAYGAEVRLILSQACFQTARKAVFNREGWAAGTSLAGRRLAPGRLPRHSSGGADAACASFLVIFAGEPLSGSAHNSPPHSPAPRGTRGRLRKRRGPRRRLPHPRGRG